LASRTWLFRSTSDCPLDRHALDLLARDLLLDRLQEALPVLIRVLLGVKLGLRQLADEPLGECPLLVANLGLGATVDLGCVAHLVGEVEISACTSWHPEKGLPQGLDASNDGRRVPGTAPARLPPDGPSGRPSRAPWP
jgi:hypothetical protein